MPIGNGSWRGLRDSAKPLGRQQIFAETSLGTNSIVARAYLGDIQPDFDLPHFVTEHLSLALIEETPLLRGHSQKSIPKETACVLDVHGIEERQSILEIGNFISAARLASKCSVKVLQYCFPGGRKIDAFPEELIIWGHHDSRLSVESVNWIGEHSKALQKYFVPEKYSRVANALRLYGEAIRVRNSDLALLGCVGAIESLFSIAPQELSFRLSLLLAKFLGDDTDSQREYFRRAKALYTVRSKIAHGDKVHDKEESAAIQIVEFWTPEAETLARQSLCLVFDKRLEDVFDAKKRHEALLTELLFEPTLDAAIKNVL